MVIKDRAAGARQSPGAGRGRTLVRLARPRGLPSARGAASGGAWRRGLEVELSETAPKRRSEKCPPRLRPDRRLSGKRRLKPSSRFPVSKTPALGGMSEVVSRPVDHTSHRRRHSNSSGGAVPSSRAAVLTETLGVGPFAWYGLWYGNYQDDHHPSGRSA